MELLNTLIVDPNDPDFYQKFDDLIQKNNFIVFVVVGDDADRQKLVESADILADDHSGKIERKVAWAKDHDILKDDCLAYLKTSPDFDETKYETVMAYVLSPKWHETKYIFLEGDAIDDFHVSKAYWRASLREREENPVT